MNKNYYYVLSVELYDCESNMMELYDADGVQEFSIDEKRVDEILGMRAYSGGDIPKEILDEVDREQKKEKNKIELFFFEKNAKERAQTAQKKIKEMMPSLKIKLEELPCNDWNEEWRKFYKPIEIGEGELGGGSKLKVIPEWMRDEIDNTKTNVLIYPGLGFGTGNHETTFLCLELFLKLKNKKLVNVLDFGCGSGILGISALKDDIDRQVTFVDIDSHALDNCLQNLELNFETQKLSGSSLVLRERFKLESQKYQLIFANILENVLLMEQALLIESLASDGILIVSGILNEQVQNILDHYNKNNDFEVIHILEKNDWRALALKKI